MSARSTVEIRTDQGPTVMLVTPNLDIGGAQETVRTLAARLPEQGCPVIVCSFADGPLRAPIEATGVTVELLPPRRQSVFSGPGFIAEMYRYRRSMRDLVRRHQVGVIQTQGLGSLDFLVMTLRRRNGPQVWWTIQNASFELRPEHVQRHPWTFRIKRGAHRLLYRVGTRCVDGVIAVSTDTRASFESVAGPSDRVVIVPNAVDLTRFPVRVDRASIRRGLGLSEDVHAMTMVGTFKRQKGHMFLVEAIPQVCERHPGLHVLLVGDGELRGSVEQQVAEAGIAEHVTFLGTRSDIPELLAASDSFVLPSLWEGLPVALVEAMASGLPVIATTVSGTNEVVVDGESGFLVPPGDPSRLADAMCRLLCDPGTAAAIAAAGQARVAARFSARTQAETLSTLFRGRAADPGRVRSWAGRRPWAATGRS